jgi:hypothetical protein
LLCLLDENSYDEALSDEVWKAITNAGIDLKEDGTLKFLEHTEEVSLLHSLFIVPSLESLKTILLTLLKLAKIKMKKKRTDKNLILSASTLVRIQDNLLIILGAP